MKKRILTLTVLIFLQIAQWALGGEKKISISTEIFQRETVTSSQEYERVSMAEGKELQNSMKNDKQLEVLIKKWRNDGVSLGEINACINGLAPGFGNYLEPTPCSKVRTTIITKHDLTICCGASAWLVEQLLDCKFPPVTASTTTETLKSIQETARTRLKEICSQSLVEEDPTKTVDVSRHNLGEKLKLASDPATSPATLDKLAQDEDVDVRRAAVKNPNTATATLKNLSGDRRVLLGKSERQDDPTLPVQAVAGSHPKMLSHFSDGNFLFLRAKKK